MKTATTILFLLTTFVCSGQYIKVDTSKSIEENERTLMTLIDTAFHQGWNIDNDSITYEDIFIDNLLLILKSPKSFKYKFPLLAKQHSDYNAWRIFIIYSDDSLFRVFNWLSSTSGTWHHFPVVYQAINQNNKTIYFYPEAAHSEEFHTSVKYDTIYRLKSTTKQLYLSIGYGQISGNSPFEAIETFEITSNSIEDSNILPDSTEMTSKIFIDRQATWYGDNGQDIPSAEYDAQKQILTIPEITGSYNEEQNIKWTGRLIRLKFNGQKFERQK